MSLKRNSPRDDLHKIPIDREHGGVATEGAIDFSASINPIGPPPAAIEEYHRAAASLTRYPDPYPDALANRIAEWLGVDAGQVLVGNGSTQLIHLISRARRWRRPIVVTPTFSEIANALTIAGSTPHALELSCELNFELRIEDVSRALEAGADVIFIGRPNSPTGSMLSFDDATAIALECARFDAHCVFDEAFIDFVDNAKSMIHLISQRPRVVILRSLTKIFAIPGLRLGFVVAEAKTIKELREMIEPWSVNAIAARVGMVCLDGADQFVERTRLFIARERDRLIHGLGQNPHLRVFPSAANFLMVAARESGADSFGAFMMRRGIAVRDLRSLPGCGPGLYRVGIRNPEDNDCLVLAAREYVGEIRE